MGNWKHRDCWGAGEPSRLAAFCVGPLYSVITLLCVEGIGLREMTPPTGALGSIGS